MAKPQPKHSMSFLRIGLDVRASRTVCRIVYPWLKDSPFLSGSLHPLSRRSYYTIPLVLPSSKRQGFPLYLLSSPMILMLKFLVCLFVFLFPLPKVTRKISTYFDLCFCWLLTRCMFWGLSALAIPRFVCLFCLSISSFETCPLESQEGIWILCLLLVYDFCSFGFILSSTI